MLRLETARASQGTVRIGALTTRAVWLSRSDLQTEEQWEPP